MDWQWMSLELVVIVGVGCTRVEGKVMCVGGLAQGSGVQGVSLVCWCVCEAWVWVRCNARKFESVEDDGLQCMGCVIFGFYKCEQKRIGLTLI